MCGGGGGLGRGGENDGPLSHSQSQTSAETCQDQSQRIKQVCRPKAHTVCHGNSPKY